MSCPFIGQIPINGICECDVANLYFPMENINMNFLTINFDKKNTCL